MILGINLKNGDFSELMKGLTDNSVDLARIIPEATLVDAMTVEPSQDEILKGLEQLRKIIPSKPIDDNKGA